MQPIQNTSLIGVSTSQEIGPMRIQSELNDSLEVINQEDTNH